MLVLGHGGGLMHGFVLWLCDGGIASRAGRPGAPRAGEDEQDGREQGGAAHGYSFPMYSATALMSASDIWAARFSMVAFFPPP